jgi:hypothetical protein
MEREDSGRKNQMQHLNKDDSFSRKMGRAAGQTIALLVTLGLVAGMTWVVVKIVTALSQELMGG